MKITLEFEVSALLDERRGLPASAEEIREALAHYLQSWSDGRYPFPVEQIHDGLQRCVEAAVERATENELRKKHGEKRIGTRRVWQWLAGKRLKGLRAWVSGYAEVPKVVLEDD